MSSYSVSLEKAMQFFIHTQKCETMEQAFLKGYLMAMGGEHVLVTSMKCISWNLIRQNPEMFIPIEQRMLNMHIEISEKGLEEAEKLAEKYGLSKYGGIKIE